MGNERKRYTIDQLKANTNACTFRDDYYSWIASQLATVPADRTAVWAKLLELRNKLISGAKWPGLSLDPTMTMPSCANN
jgi:hypothetical protein